MGSKSKKSTSIPQTALQVKTHGIVSKIAYLIGVPVKVFEKEQEPPEIETFRQLNKEKRARIIRNLCAIRTALETNFQDINNKMILDHVPPTSMPDLIPQRCIDQLVRDGVSFIKASNKLLVEHIIEINRIISERIYNCRSFFPSWIRWEYIQDLFIMPDGLTVDGAEKAAWVYYDNMTYYPYGKYINWPPFNAGNLLENDQKFLRHLYKWHNDEFTDYTKLTGIRHIRDAIFEYVIAKDEKTAVLVDCEHANPYKLSAALKWLDAESREKITSVILLEDGHTDSEWNIVERFVGLPVERSKRVKQTEDAQSLAGVVNLLSCAYQEHYGNHVNSFIVVSNNPEHWTLLSPLPGVRSFLMVERDKCSQNEKDALIRSRGEIPFCYVDDSYPDDSTEIKTFTLFQTLHQALGQAVCFNAYEMLDTALQTVQMKMTKDERQQFYNQYIGTMQMVIGQNGDVTVDISERY